MLKTVALMLVALALPQQRAAASISGTPTWATLSADGSSILVMHSCNPAYETPPAFSLPDRQIVWLRNTFPQSGLYDVATGKPHWTVCGYWDEFAVRYSPDLQHAVHVNPYGYRGVTGLEFFNRTGLVRTYACSELLTHLDADWFVPFTTSGWRDQWEEDYSIDTAKQRFYLTSVRRQTWLFGHHLDFARQEFYTFDFKTGEIIEQRVTGAWAIWLYAAAVILIPALCSIIIRKTWRLVSRLLTSDQRGFPVLPAASSD